MTVAEALQQFQTSLTESGIETARLDTLVLMEFVLGVDRAKLLAYLELSITKAQQNVLSALIARRKQHEPLAYVLGKSEFYGREFIVSPAVLVPRPESEAMIDLLKFLAPDIRQRAAERAAQDTSYQFRIADIGTGSGVLGITAALEFENSVVELLDIDQNALNMAKKNVIKHTTCISVLKADLLPKNPQYDVLLCNLPYIPDNFNINRAAKFEPNIALFAGLDGLDLYRRLFEKLLIVRTKPLLILTEALPQQHAALTTVAKESGYRLVQEMDFIQAFSSQAELLR